MVGHIRGLQRAVGNRAVASFFGRDESDDEETSGTESTTEDVSVAVPVTDPAKSGVGPSGGPAGGVAFPDSEASGEAVHAEGCDSVEASVGYEGGHVERKGSDYFAPTDFGFATPGVKLTNSRVYVVDNTAYVTGKVTLWTRWNVQSQGRKNVDTDDVQEVTKASVFTIMNDLKPNDKGKPSRESYWVRRITEEHEKFHCKDMIRLGGSAVKVANAELGTKTVDLPWFGDKDAAAAKQLAPAIAQYPSTVETALSKAFGPGADGRAEKEAYKADKPKYEEVRAYLRLLQEQTGFAGKGAKLPD